MGSLLAKLLDLQKQHIHLRSLTERARIANAAVAARERRLGELKAQVEALTQDRKASQRASDLKELEIKTQQSKIARFREQLNTEKITNREYQTLQNEIKFAEAELRRVEDQVLAEMERVEQAGRKIDEARSALAEAEREVAELKARTAAEAEALAAEIRKAEREKADMARELPRDVVELFERIARKGDNGAMCPLVRDEENPMEETYSCGGCYMRLTQNIYVKLLGNTDEIILCPNCSHILYLEP